MPTKAMPGSPDLDYSGFVDLAAPAKMPASIISFLNEELNGVAHTRHIALRVSVRHAGAAPRNRASPGRLPRSRNASR
jgi:hypothetical protein